MPSTNDTNTDRTVLVVSGMTCFACVHGVTGALSRVPGVTRVEVNLDTGRAIVHGGADPEALIGAVARTGYGARRAEGEAEEG